MAQATRWGAARLRAAGLDLQGALVRDRHQQGLDLPPRSARSLEIARPGPTVRRYLVRSGALARPVDWGWQARMTGSFRTKPGDTYMPYESWRYDDGPSTSRLCHSRTDVAGVLPMVGRDAYVRGRGATSGRLLGLVRVATGSGLEHDISELSAFLAESLLWCPSLLGGLRTTWEDLDATSFRVRLQDRSLTVAGTVHVDPTGLPVSFTTADRYLVIGGRPVRSDWRAEVGGWVSLDDHPMPTELRATWQLPDGPFRYLTCEVDVASVRFDHLPLRSRRFDPVAPLELAGAFGR